MSKLLERYLSSSWPNRSLCDANKWRHPMPTADNLPQLFMSPDNKGYRSRLQFLSIFFLN